MGQRAPTSPMSGFHHGLAARTLMAACEASTVADPVCRAGVFLLDISDVVLRGFPAPVRRFDLFQFLVELLPFLERRILVDCHLRLPPAPDFPLSRVRS